MLITVEIRVCSCLRQQPCLLCVHRYVIALTKIDLLHAVLMVFTISGIVSSQLRRVIWRFELFSNAMRQPLPRCPDRCRVTCAGRWLFTRRL